MAPIDVLIPTCNRVDSLIFTLGGVIGQTYPEINLILADQSDEPVERSPVVQACFRIIEARGGSVNYFFRVHLKGIAEQRDFLLSNATAPEVLFLDDDVFMESWVLAKAHEILNAEQCAFVGAFPSGLTFINDHRPEQEKIEYWEGPVQPEAVEPDSPEWERWQLHRAANLFHVMQNLQPQDVLRYKVAWVASCILYDREKLVEIGGFSFWNRLPRFHSGEEVLVQNLLMRRWGGCGMIPTGTYSSELPSTVLNELGRVDGHALELLPEMIEKYIPAEMKRNHDR